MHHLADSMTELCNSGKHNNALGRDLQYTTLLEKKLNSGEEAKHVAIGRGFKLVLFIVPLLVVLESDAGQLCASCNDIAKVDDCHRFVRCENDEKCFIRRYANATGSEVYELGCISAQACQYSQNPIVGKRRAELHSKCLACCNDTALCNQDSGCIAPKAERQTFVSCSKVSDPVQCSHNVVCDLNEKCYTYRFMNGSGATYYELGCIPKELCRPSHDVLSVKRDDYHHLRCATCCDNGSLCNQQGACSSNLSKSTIKQTATTSTQRPSSKARDCSGLLGTRRHNSTYTIYPYGPSGESVAVYCEYNTDGVWTVIQRRIDGSVDFSRNWTEYKDGFCNVAGEYWLGNEALHEITSHGNYTLKIVLTDWVGVTKVAEYSLFRIGDESTGYRLTVGGYLGDAGDSMARYDGLQFSTRDRDNDGRSSVNCAKDAGQAGWWYKWFLVYCSWSNLNGVYHHSPRTTDYTGIWWGHWHGWYYSLKATTMMVRNT